MSSDLFSNDYDLEHIPLPDSEIYFLRKTKFDSRGQEILKKLVDETPWRTEKISVWGKSFLQPRLIAWYGEEGKIYTYSGISMAPLPWTPLLRSLLTEVEVLTGERFNSALLNYYRNENDSMGFHSDDEKELGRFPVIASLSFGQERDLIFKHKTKNIKPLRIALPSGSLLIMKGMTQLHWKHGIEKISSPMGPRINITFRKIFDRTSKA